MTQPPILAYRLNCSVFCEVKPTLTPALNLLYCLKGLWEKFNNELSDDFRFHRTQQHSAPRRPNTPAPQPFASDINAALHALEDIFSSIEKTLSDFQLPIPPPRLGDSTNGHTASMARELAYDKEVLQRRVDDNLCKLNVEQRAFYDAILADIYGGGPVRPKAHFLQAPGGCGKTFVMQLLLDTVRAKGHVAIAVASTGVASLLLSGGTTAHFRFKIPIAISTDSTSSISPSSHHGKALAAAKLIIWDEAVTLHKHGHDVVNRLLQDIKSAQASALAQCTDDLVAKAAAQADADLCMTTIYGG